MEDSYGVLTIDGASYQKVKTPNFDFEGVKIRASRKDTEILLQLDMEEAEYLRDRLDSIVEEY